MFIIHLAQPPKASGKSRIEIAVQKVAQSKSKIVDEGPQQRPSFTSPLPTNTQTESAFSIWFRSVKEA
jgi:hypothetical protein